MSASEPSRNAFIAIAVSVAGVLVYLLVSRTVQWLILGYSSSEGIAVTVSSGVLIPICMIVRQRLMVLDGRATAKRDVPDLQLVALALVTGICLAIVSSTFMGGDAVAPEPDMWVVIGYGLGAPVAEELLFRGIILDGARRVFSKMGALVFSSALFAIGHVAPMQIIFACIAGVCFGLFFLLRGSIVEAAIAHSIANLASLALSWGVVNVVELPIAGVVASIILAGIIIGLARKARFQEA